jgi:hypothetical protein
MNGVVILGWRIFFFSTHAEAFPLYIRRKIAKKTGEHSRVAKLQQEKQEEDSDSSFDLT